MSYTESNFDADGTTYGVKSPKVIESLSTVGVTATTFTPNYFETQYWTDLVTTTWDDVLLDWSATTNYGIKPPKITTFTEVS
tara:strand:+ start:1048 stop:1293 length:246 start_codon:yes stop_codon:yes gene_type:complete